MSVEINISETAAKMFFFLVDAVDGLTAEVGEAGGAAEISKNGAAWGTTGIGTLNHIGNGHYYADVDLTNGTLAVSLGDRLIGRFKSAATAEAPSLTEMVAVDHDAGELHLIKAMLSNKRTHTVSTGVDKIFDDDGTTLLKTMTPTDDDDDTVTITPT